MASEGAHVGYVQRAASRRAESGWTADNFGLPGATASL